MAEQRLIDANALRNQVMNEIRHYWNCGGGGYYLAEDVIPDIDDAPTVDAVEVVRCKDCKHYNPRNQSAHWKQTALCCTRVAWATYPEDGFCSYGEKKGDGNG